MKCNFVFKIIISNYVLNYSIHCRNMEQNMPTHVNITKSCRQLMLPQMYNPIHQSMPLCLEFNKTAAPQLFLCNKPALSPAVIDSATHRTSGNHGACMVSCTSAGGN